jgi:hypothetical protein
VSYQYLNGLQAARRRLTAALTFVMLTAGTMSCGCS